MNLNDRAITTEQKQLIIEQLYKIWLTIPELRLGQLIFNATHNNQYHADLFYIEDFELIKIIEKFAK